jgi:hypothetical protein
METCLAGSVNDAMALRRPVLNELLRTVATGEKSDRAVAANSTLAEFTNGNG